MKTGTSIWKQDTYIKERPPLHGDLEAEAAVIGGGMAGILTAHFLSEAGLHTVVLEADRVGSGQTGNTTAKITSQHGLIYEHLCSRFGMERAQQYADANQSAIREYRRIILEKEIDCGFTSCAAYLYAMEDWNSIGREYEAAQSLGIPCDYVEETELPFPVAAALCFEDQARFHPLKFLQAVAEPLTIYEHTKVLDVKGRTIETDRGRVIADHIIFCCHYPFLNIPGYYFLRMHQERSYVTAWKHTPGIADMYLGVDGEQLSFRMAGDLLLLGGAGHRTGKNPEGGQYEMLRKAAKSWWHGCREETAWSAQDCMTLDKVPYIGRFARETPNWYVATGFQKWGMTASMAAARILSDLVLERANPWKEVFSPRRFVLSASAVPLLQEMGQAAKGLTLGAIDLHRNSDAEDEDKAPCCPHLGCRLAWNPEEETWECPCHGSRFDKNGKLLAGPAQEDLGRTEELPEKKVAAEALGRLGQKLGRK